MISRKFLAYERIFKKVFLTALFTLIPAFANAVVIVLEPDDYGMGVPLENEYVTVTSTDGGPNPWSELNAITAKDSSRWDDDYQAPTGNLTFGNFALTPGFTRGDLVFGWGGLLLRFNQAVSNVSLLANSGYREQWFVGIGWIAYDLEGEEIGRGTAGVREEESDATFKIEVNHEDIGAVILGGAETIPYIYFDHLTFEVAEASVPEPSPLILLLMGLAMFALRRNLAEK